MCSICNVLLEVTRAVLVPVVTLPSSLAGAGNPAVFNKLCGWQASEGMGGSGKCVCGFNASKLRTIIITPTPPLIVVALGSTLSDNMLGQPMQGAGITPELAGDGLTLLGATKVRDYRMQCGRLGHNIIAGLDRGAEVGAGRCRCGGCVYVCLGGWKGGCACVCILFAPLYA